MATPLALDPRLGIDAASNLTALRTPRAQDPHAKARGQAQDFEAVYLNSMFQQMYSGLDGEGPFGNSTGVGPWRSFLTEEYSKMLAKKGGIGLADHVYTALIGQQEAKQAARAAARPQD